MGFNTKSTRLICGRALRLSNSFLAKRRHRQLAQRLFAILHTIGMFVADVALASSPTEDRTAAGTAPVRKCRPGNLWPYPVHIPCFPALAYKFPVLAEKFPVLLRRESYRKPLDLLVSTPSDSLRNAEFCKNSLLISLLAGNSDA